MKNKIFFTDLDSTMIVNSKESKYRDETKYVCVSKKYGQPAAFMTIENYQKLKELSEQVTIIPITSRCLSSYMDIDLGFTPEYALIENGAILLENNVVNKRWINNSELRLLGCQPIYSEIRKKLIENGYYEKWGSAFLIDFISDNPEKERMTKVIEELKKEFSNIRFYPTTSYKGISFVTEKITKATTISRFMNTFGLKDTNIFVAGDAEPDWEMLFMFENSYGLSDSYAKHKFDKQKWKDDINSFTSFILDSINKEIKGNSCC